MLCWGLRKCPSCSPCHSKESYAGSDRSTKSCAFHSKKPFICIVFLSLVFSFLVLYTKPLQSYSFLSALPTSTRPGVKHGNGWSSSALHSQNSSAVVIPLFSVPYSSSQQNLIESQGFSRHPRLKVKGAQRRLPEVLIIGVRKCGTRALLEMLNLHPNIRKRDAEVHFFDDDDRYSRGLEWYRRKMPISFDNQITIEKTPSYFVSHEAPARIYAMDPNIKLLLIVRDPAVRVLSDYAQILESKRAKGSYFKPFHKLVFLPNGDINDSYNAIQISQYLIHILRWLRVFSRSQLHIVDGDRLIQNPYSETRKVEKFLGLPSRIQSSNFYFNRTKGFYCMRNETHQKCLADSKGRRHPYVDPGIMERLRRYFAPFNEEFYKRVGQNFSWPTS
ncbi:Sulfotransferase domain [Trinorchestia longiramus]|nr:Sulfotransferase domain [Trinorchestia longiramus]